MANKFDTTFGINRNSSPNTSAECICDRNERIIQCTGCGYIAKGRASRACKHHPSVIYLLDFQFCPLCDTPADYITEYETVKVAASDNIKKSKKKY